MLRTKPWAWLGPVLRRIGDGKGRKGAPDLLPSPWWYCAKTDHTLGFLIHFYKIWAGLRASGYSSSSRKGGIICWSCLPGSGRRWSHANSCNSSQLPITSQPGEGDGGWGQAPEAPALLASPFSPFYLFPSGTWLGAEQKAGSSQREVYGTEHQGEGALGPRGRDLTLPPYSSPTEFTARKKNTSSPTTPRGGISSPGSEGTGR